MSFSFFLVSNFLPKLNDQTYTRSNTRHARDVVLRAMLLNYTELVREQPELEDVLKKTAFDRLWN